MFHPGRHDKRLAFFKTKWRTIEFDLYLPVQYLDERIERSGVLAEPLPLSNEKRVMLPASFLSTCLLTTPPAAYSIRSFKAITVDFGKVSFMVCFVLYPLFHIFSRRLGDRPDTEVPGQHFRHIRGQECREHRSEVDVFDTQTE